MKETNTFTELHKQKGNNNNYYYRCRKVFIGLLKWNMEKSNYKKKPKFERWKIKKIKKKYYILLLYATYLKES